MYRVMLAEDDRALRYVYSRMKSWAKYGFLITKEVSNGVQALEFIKENPVDVIITDIQMPFMDGIEMMKLVRQVSPDVLVVFVTSYNEFEYAREGLRLGAVDYVVKPMKEKDLEEVLERLSGILAEQKKEDPVHIFENIVTEKVNWEEPVLQNMCTYLKNNLQRNLTLEEVAEELNLNKDYLGKVVKNKTGLNFRNLYNRFKTEYAKPLIKSGQYKIYEISEMLGYTSADYFTQIFKSNTGMTPAEYKKSETTVF